MFLNNKNILFGKSLAETHRAFLNALPIESTKSILLKITAVAGLGLPLSFVALLISIFVANINPAKEKSLNYLLSMIIQDIPFFLITFVIFYRKKINQTFVDLFPKNINKSLLLIAGFILLDLIIGILIYIPSFIFPYLSSSPENVQIRVQIRNWLEQFINSGPNSYSFDYFYLLLGGFVGFLIVAFFEEFIFRFTLYRFLRKKGLIFALIVSSLLFGLVHGQGNILSTFIFGVAYALFYEYSNNFWATVLVHAISNNFIVSYVFYIYYLIYQNLR